MMCLLGTILALLLVAQCCSGQDSPCADLDTTACIRMHDSEPKLCTTSLAHTACPKFCGVCPTTTTLTTSTTTTLLPGLAPCEDMSTTACELMYKSQPNICNDPDVADTACKRFCGLCPLLCYECSSTVRTMQECNTTTYCELHEECYIMEMFEFDQSHGFKAGCLSKDLCIPQSLGMIGKRSSSLVHIGCCDGDKCNNDINM